MTQPALGSNDSAHARFAVGLVTAARDGFDAFLDGYVALLDDLEEDGAHLPHRDFFHAKVEWWLARMTLAFAEEAAVRVGDDPVGDLIRGWAAGLALFDAGDGETD